MRVSTHMVTWGIAAIALVTLGMREISAIQPDPAESAAAVTAFERSVADYAALRARATLGLPAAENSRGAEEILQAVDLRHAAIAAARPAARRGDLFSDPVAALFRSRIRAALASRGISEMRALAIVDGDSEGLRPVLRINGWFPWTHGSAMFACALEALPPLPAGLEYRFVHSHLVLVDVDASLVVDILPDVFRSGSYT